jgi:hypothetical protein
LLELDSLIWQKHWKENYCNTSSSLTKGSIKQHNKEIDEAIARVEAGEYYTHEEVERMAKEW